MPGRSNWFERQLAAKRADAPRSGCEFAGYAEPSFPAPFDRISDPQLPLTRLISNPVSRELIFLDDNGRIAQVERGEGMGVGFGWAFEDCVPQWRDEHQMLFGVRCRRELLKQCQSKEDAGEPWISDELMVVFSESSSNHDWRITEWKSQDPSAALFQIPDGYHILDHEF